MTSTSDKRLAYAIGYLRGISAILWNLDGEKRNVAFSCEEADHYDHQVDVLAREVFKEDDDGISD